MTDVEVARVASSIKSKLGDIPSINAALVLGSGLGNIASCFDVLYHLPYADIDGFPQSSAPGHSGCLQLVSYQQHVLLIFQGRFHLYEGWSAGQVALPSYLSRHLGASYLLLTNAAGSLNPDYANGDVMLLEDHINFTGHSPLIGVNNEQNGPRFPDMSQVYDRQLRAFAIQASERANISLRQGIYAGVTGPQLETNAERRFLRLAGADAVGMSTVIETIAAIHCGLKVLALSAITNSATGSHDQQPDTIDECLANAAIAGDKIGRLLPHIVSSLTR